MEEVTPPADTTPTPPVEQPGGGGSPPTPVPEPSGPSVEELQAQLRATEEKLKTAETNWSHAQRLMSNDTTEEEYREAAYHMFRERGVPESELSAYYERAMNQGQEEEETTDVTNEPKLTTEQQEIQELKAELQSLKQDSTNNRARHIGEAVSKSTRSIVDSSPEAGVLFKGLTRLHDAEHAEKARELYLKKVEQKTKEILVDRKNRSGGVFQESWIEEAASQANKAVSEEYTMVIGDVDKLGRSPETDGGRISVAPKEVPAPEHKKRSGTADLSRELQDWGTSKLARALAEGDGDDAAA